MNEIIVELHELEARLSKYLREVKTGKVVIITEHVKPIGRIIPEGQSIEKRLLGLSETGSISWSGNRVIAHKPVVENRSDKLVSDILVKMRE